MQVHRELRVGRGRPVADVVGEARVEDHLALLGREHQIDRLAVGEVRTRVLDGVVQVRVVAYENLTERGQELYVGALENDGEYRVPEGEGAPVFVYATDADRRGAMESQNMTAAGRVVIERPADDSSLPAADERYYPREEGLNETEREQRREQALRYDLMQTSKEQPPLGSPPQLLRLGAVVFAVIFLGTGGYFLSSKG